MRSLRRILGIRWFDHVTNLEVKERTRLEDIESRIRRNQSRNNRSILIILTKEILREFLIQFGLGNSVPSHLLLLLLRHVSAEKKFRCKTEAKT